MTAEPMRPLSSIDVLDAGEHARLEEVGNRAVLTAAGVRNGCGGVDSGVVRRAGGPSRPRRWRSATGSGRWSYRELDEAANRVARLLAGQGAGPGQRVAVVMPRSAQAIAAMVAVLKTGAAYVPIDPAHPDARIGFVLGDAAPLAALTTADLRPRLDGP